LLVRLIQIEKPIRGGSPRLLEVYLNPQHIISVADDYQMNEILLNEVSELGLQDGVRFSRVVIQEGNVPKSITIVGTPSEVHRKIKKKQILRG
tara:strand:+ start:174 stop:452 length:279 start_codon:yes stop_codon:yes gene_type:complete